VFSADAVEFAPEPVLQIPEGDVAPGQELTGASRVALDVAIVAHADFLEAPVRGVSVGAERAFSFGKRSSNSSRVFGNSIRESSRNAPWVSGASGTVIRLSQRDRQSRTYAHRHGVDAPEQRDWTWPL
jgi:hypothetical protein